MDTRLWHTNSRLSIKDRVELIQMRAAMSRRDRDLASPDIILLFQPEEIEARDTAEGRKVILAKIEKALSAEVRRGEQSHWSYDISRHQRLNRLYRGELAALQQEAA